MRRWAQVFVLLMVTNAAAGVLADPIQVGVQALETNTSLITLDTDVQAAPVSLWTLLTDYDHQALFLPYITQSRVVGKEGPDLLVDQAGTIKILFWSFTMRMTQRISEGPPNHMHFKTIRGDFTRLEGDFNLTPSSSTAEQTHLACRFTVQPKRHVPDWAVRMAARHYLRKMVHVLAAKAEKS